MSDESARYTQQSSPEEIMLEALRNLRENPQTYQRLRKALQEATDEARVQTLIRFATSEQELAALLPARAETVQGGKMALAWTTVTVTTVLIPDTAY